ncbi:MAG: spore cortex biosynthesis protein YabQ [Lachnospiraceae bacterium]|jgi:spore cortex biosynthesis protein YabQ|nr:spore cortex biosynthesis protein YabQ [Lachnospiraceae bacterium]
MSEDILFEVNFFLHSFIMGVIITFGYDWFIILRRLIRHNTVMVSLEDLIFWIACALGVFYMLYRENNGILRWFAVLGAAVGMWIYKRTVSIPFVTVVAKIISKVTSLLFRPIAFAIKKIIQLFSFLLNSFKSRLLKLLRLVKKKLTIQLKLVKLMLCKRKEIRRQELQIKQDLKQPIRNKSRVKR